MRLRVLGWRGYAGTLDVITRVLVRRQESREHPRLEAEVSKRGAAGRRPAGSEPGEGAAPQRMQEASRRSERQGSGLSPRPPEETLPCRPGLDC